MTQYLIKLLISASVIVLASEVAKRSGWWGALIVSLPVTSLLAMFWLHQDTGDLKQVAAFSRSIFWLVIPSLALFLVFPWAVERGMGFWRALAAGTFASLASYGVVILAMKAITTRPW
jgi:hypothetical protein